MAAWCRLVLMVLALWRLSAWLWYEHSATGARAWLCRWPWATKQLDCFWCVTFWLAWPVAVAGWLAPWLLAPVALSGAVVLLSGGGRMVWREMVDAGENHGQG